MRQADLLGVAALALVLALVPTFTVIVFDSAEALVRWEAASLTYPIAQTK